VGVQLGPVNGRGLSNPITSRRQPVNGMESPLVGLSYRAGRWQRRV